MQLTEGVMGAAGRWWTGVRRVVGILVLSAATFSLVVSRGADSLVAQETNSPPTSAYAADEVIIRYSRLSGEEAVGLGIATEHAEVAALALQIN
jgi:hypothetical protein